MPAQGSLPDLTNPATVDFTPFQQEENVSMTNLGQSSQQFMQVARTSQPQPGPQETFVSSAVQQSLSSPRTPQRTLRPQSPAQPPLSPTKLPTEQELKNLHEHIQSVYGSCGQVFINILPTPTATPQKPTRLQSHDTFDTAPMPPNFSDMADINLEPTSSAMAFDFENPDADIGYESSSYYTSDALSPSPQSSPHQKSLQMFLEDIQELPAQELAYSDAPTLPLPARTNSIVDAFPFPAGVLAPSSVLTDPEVDASLEYTGISPEEVQRYISEQDLATAKWTCLYPECGKQFGRRENIRAHVQTHLGDRQFRCNGCGKCFVRQHDLKRHSKIHTGKKPYTCPCSAGFARQDALTRHRQRGMCVGGFPDAVRRQAKRGRPKKTRPDLEERMDKASRTRRALASSASSISAESPQSDFQSGSSSPAPFDEYTPSGLPDGLPDMNSFGDTINASNDQMRSVNSSRHECHH
jgi:regulatory protein SWI5